MESKIRYGKFLTKSIAIMVVMIFSITGTQAQDQKKQKINEEANAFRLSDVTSASVEAAELGEAPKGEPSGKTGLKFRTPEQENEILKNNRRLKKVSLNKIGLARINEERLKKEKKKLVAGVDLQVASVDGDSLSVPVNEDTNEAAVAAELIDGEPMGEALPAYVNNSTLKYFPPIGNQGSVNSCVGWAESYYSVTHALAMQYDWDAKASNSNRFSPMFTYNFVNEGLDDGSYMWDHYRLAKIHGVARQSEFAPSSYKTWTTNPAIYRRAIESRISDYILIYNVDTPEGLNTIKALLNNGHVATFATHINSWSYTTVSNDPSTADDDGFVGKQIAKGYSYKNSGHAMTIVGYNDNIWCDNNGNSVVDANEKGALLIANSWGTGWKNSGYCWVSYSAVLNTDIIRSGYAAYAVAKPEPHVPKVLAKITLNHTLRDQVYARVGINNVGTTQPSSYVFPNMVYYQGGAYAFNGSAATSQDFTYYLDFTDIAPSMGSLKRWFVQGIDSGTNNGNLTIKSYELYYVKDGVDTLVGVASNLPQLANGNTQNAWIDWTMGDVKPIVTWSNTSQSSINESGTLTITAQLSAASEFPVTVPFTLSGTATNGVDYTVTSSPITIPTGATTGSATLTISPDSILEKGGESVILTMGTPDQAFLGANIVHKATITDDDNTAPDANAGPDQMVSLTETVAIPWTPVKLTSSPAAWYDGADASTITQSSGAVSQWRDKSAAARNLNQSSSGARPKTGTRTINGLNAIEFDGTDDFLTGASNRTDAITIFGVVHADSGSGTEAARSWLSAPGGSNPDYQMQAPSNADTLGATIRDTSTNGNGGTAAAGRNSAHIHAAYSWVPNGANGAVRIDGGAASAPINAMANTLQKLATELAIGRQKTGFERFHDGLIGEVIILNRRLTETDDEFLKIEGYLAHKWGLTANLPEGHPYKTAAPSSGSTLVATATLAGTASDPDNDPLTTTWTVVSKPIGSTVTFSNASALNATATFSALGDYTLRLVVNDGTASASDEVVITVTDGSSGLIAFNNWAATGGIAFNGDSNSDGVADGMGWLLGAESSTHNTNGLLPQTAENNGDLTLIFKMLNSTQRGSAIIYLQYSSDLGITDSWSNNTIQVPDASGTVNGVEFVISPIGGTDHNQVQVIIPASAAGGEGKVFARLQGMLEQ